MALADIKADFYKVRRQFVIVDNKGKIIDSDDALFKLRNGSFIQKEHPFFESLDMLFAEGQEFQLNCVHLGKEDQFICDVEMKNLDENLLLILTDFTEHYAELQKVTQTRNESVIAKQFLDLQNKFLKEKEEFKNKFIANFSHEIRNPLTSILTFSQMLKHTELSNDQLDYANVIQSSTVDLKNMLEDIMDISRIETGKFSLENEAFSLAMLINDLERTYAIKTKNQGLDLIIDYDKRIPDLIEGDPVRLKQILVNLLNNALKFTQKGNITLHVEQNYRRGNRANIHFSVSDTGAGIKEKDLDRVFESFAQLEAGKGKGVGLGLSIVKQILSLMESDIKLESTFGKGSKFSFNTNFNFPLKQSEKKPAATTSSTTPTEVKKPVRKKKLKALLIEDSEMTQMVILKILVSTGDFYVEIFNSADGVLEDLKHHEYDIIFMDIKLEGIQGDDLATKIRRLGFNNTRTIPIIAVTAYHKPKDISRYKRAGITETIHKPFDEETLLKVAYSYLN